MRQAEHFLVCFIFVYLDLILFGSSTDTMQIDLDKIEQFKNETTILYLKFQIINHFI